MKRGIWPCTWVALEDAGKPPFVTAYRRHFVLDRDARIRVHVSADERYELFLDGARIGRGSERGDGRNWFFETYDLSLEQGEHVIVARVWSLGALAPYAQMSVRPGFILSPQEREFVLLLGTGVADWKAKRLQGYEFTDPMAAWGTGANLVVDGSRFDWGFEHGQGGGWEPVLALDAGADALRRNEFPPMHLMKPATLPPMMEVERFPGVVRFLAEIASAETHAVPIREADNLVAEIEPWNQLIAGVGSLLVPPRTRRRALIDLHNYYCAYPEVVVSGGAGSSIRVHWQESLYCEPEARTKGNRDQIEGKYFVTVWHRKDGIGDTFKPDGGQQRRFETLWWQCGRYIEVVVQTGDEPLRIESFKLRETRYPLEMESAFAASDERLAGVVPIALRALQMCAHETYMDCPYFEQLMYVGDTRLEALITYVLTRDDRLPRKALRMFDASRLPSGLTQSRYPSRVTQVIPSCCPWWVAMVHDFARWRDDEAFVRGLMPGVRAVVGSFRAFLTADGLLQAPEVWNYRDYVPACK